LQNKKKNKAGTNREEDMNRKQRRKAKSKAGGGVMRADRKTQVTHLKNLHDGKGSNNN
tara:strand:- start:702 stop:875 length:174 start_codon:yes stop_codon:yes gene_type:complete